MDLTKAIPRSEDMMERVLILGRLLSENKGIVTLVHYIKTLKVGLIV
jgi:hypothetical protein